MAFRGVLIAEGLNDPTMVNRLMVYRAQISKEGVPIDYEGHLGRWHLYWVHAERETISAIQANIKRGWYAHFWGGDHLIVVFDDATFELSRTDPSSWQPAIEHGERQGIPRDELDFEMEP